MKVDGFSRCWIGASLFGLALAGAAAEPPAGATEPDPDWPCEQARVPEVSAAVVWDGPSVDGLGQAWRDNPPVHDLVQRITGPRVSDGEAQQAIDAFAQGLPAGEKDRMLTLAFAGVLETLNQDRKLLMSGIDRYSRDQEHRAEVLGKDLDEMVRLEQDNSDAGRQQLDALKHRLELEQRMFDEREKTIPYLCSRPVAVEQRIGTLARALAGYLD